MAELPTLSRTDPIPLDVLFKEGVTISPYHLTLAPEYDDLYKEGEFFGLSLYDKVRKRHKELHG